jgi:ribonuclease Z
MRLAGIEVDAVSVGGIETCIAIPSWKTCFDIGRCPPAAVSCGRVCFTHGHVDHVGGVLHHASLRDLYGLGPADYLVPEPYLEPFGALLDAARRLSRSELPANIVPVDVGTVVEAGPDRRIHVFRSYHRVPTFGYALEAQRRRLRADLAGLPGPEIALARARGEEVSETFRSLEVAFCGDTLVDVIDREAMVREARLLILECTFADQRVDVDAARRMGHVHLDEIAARAALFRNEAILLTHFSARHGGAEILRLLDEKLPADLRNRVTPLLRD